jgi:hypothetical protein
MEIGDEAVVTKPLDRSHKLNHVGFITEIDDMLSDRDNGRYAVDGLWCRQCRLLKPIKELDSKRDKRILTKLLKELK